MMYTFHKYWTAPTPDVIQEYLDYGSRYNVPVWIGESGENTDQWIEQFVRMLEKNKVGWCFWPYKKMEQTSSVMAFKEPAQWAEIVAHAKMPGNSGDTEKRIVSRPSLEHGREALRDLLQKNPLRELSSQGFLKALGFHVPSR